MAFWKAICPDCGKPILKTHRFRIVYRRVFWFWTREEWHHRNCDFPELTIVNPYKGLRIEQRKMNEHLAETLFGKPE